MFGLPLVFFVEHVEGFSIEGEVLVVDAIREFPGFGEEVDFCGFGGGAERGVGY